MQLMNTKNKFNGCAVIAGFNEIQRKYNLNRLSQRRLIQRNILPLTPTPLLANLCGHLIGDGSLKLTNKNQGSIRFYGTEEKLNQIAKDYTSLFGKKVSLTKRVRKNDPGVKIMFSDTNIARILAHIGIPAGDKVLSAFQVPSWIINGEKEIKRSFLQALCDDELGCIYKDKIKPNTWYGLRFKMSKKKEIIIQHAFFLEQLRTLFGEFGINTSKIKVMPNQSYARKDGNISYPAYFKILNSKPNRLKFYQEVGFKRDRRKNERLIKSLT